MPDFSTRSDTPELMDDLAIGGPELRQTLAEIATINRWLGGYAPSLTGLARLLPPATREFSVLDVGTGSGDTPRAIVKWAATRNLSPRIVGIDLAETTVEFARESCATFAPAIAIELKNLFDFPPVPTFDVVHAALVLHHFPGDDAARALRHMAALARFGVVVNDLHRHPFAYHSIRLITRALSGNRLIRHDAPVSVLRAFRRADWLDLAARAGLPVPEIRWMWAFRWRVLFRGTPA